MAAVAPRLRGLNAARVRLGHGHAFSTTLLVGLAPAALAAAAATLAARALARHVLVAGWLLFVVGVLWGHRFGQSINLKICIKMRRHMGG